MKSNANMRFAALALCLWLSGCGDASSAYDRPLPTRGDSEALLNIRDDLRPEDHQAWQRIVMRMVNPMAQPSTAKTVGEAIAREQARSKCLAAHDSSKLGSGPSDIGAPDYDRRNSAHIDAYNKEVEAYNACLKLPA